MAKKYNYCKISTEQSTITAENPDCLVDYNSLLTQEGCNINTPFSNNEVVINLDKVEANIAIQQGRAPSKSMDSAFYVMYEGKRKVVLVEYKFNNTSFYSIRKKDLEGKVLGSSNNFPPESSIYHNYYFIVHKEFYQEAYSRLFRMIPKLKSEYLITDIESLKKDFF